MKTGSRILSLLGVVLLGNASPATFAALRWERTHVEQTLPAGSDLVEVRFAFSNPETHPVSIVHLEASCGCTTPTVEKYTFASGEKGEVTALFDAKGLSDVQEKTIQVISDDDPKPVTLTLRMTIPPWLEISPRVLWWSVGEDNKAKEALVTLNPAANAKITSVKTNSPAVDVELLPGAAHGQYRLNAKPVSTKTKAQTAVTLTLEVSGSAPRSYVIFTQIR